MTGPAGGPPPLARHLRSPPVPPGRDRLSRASATAAPRRPSTATTCSASTTTLGSYSLALGWREAHGAFRAVFRGYVEQDWGTAGDETEWARPPGLRAVLVGREAGRARSGSSASPGARASPGTRPTASSRRRTPSTRRSNRKGPSPRALDWAPAAWASVVLVGATTDATLSDLPLAEAHGRTSQQGGGPRAVPREGHGRRPRRLGREEPAHPLRSRPRAATSAPPWPSTPRPPCTRGRRCSRRAGTEQSVYSRIVAGALKTRGENTFALEYFYNGEGYSDAGAALWLRTVARPLLGPWPTDPGGAPRAAAESTCRPTASACPSRTPMVSACAATTSTRRGRAAGQR